jgi:hypothetical protein
LNSCSDRGEFSIAGLYSKSLHIATFKVDYTLSIATVLTVHRQCHLVNDGGRREENKMLRRHAPAPKKA